MPLLAGSRNRVEAPQFFAGLRIEGRDEAAHAKVAAGRARDDLVLHDERRYGEGVAGFGAGSSHGNVPQFASALGIERDEATVDRSHEERLAENREPAIDATTTRAS